jgi:hypothetical protein
MTNDDLLDLYKQNVSESHIAALKTVYNAGYYAGAGFTPSANATDFTRFQTKPSAVVKAKHGV